MDYKPDGLDVCSLTGKQVDDAGQEGRRVWMASRVFELVKVTNIFTLLYAYDFSRFVMADDEAKGYFCL